MCDWDTYYGVPDSELKTLMFAEYSAAERTYQEFKKKVMEVSTMDIKKRMELFYTDKGIIGKSALMLGLEQIAPMDRVIDNYHNEGIYSPEVYKLPERILVGLYIALEKYYRDFYDELMENNDTENRDILTGYHHDVVHRLTEEINTRRKKRMDIMEEFRTTKKVKITYKDEEIEEIYRSLRKAQLEEANMWREVIGGEDDALKK